jgi:crossover junction endodeoxyribonuclease RusA
MVTPNPFEVGSVLDLFVPGRARTQGSKNYVGRTRSGRAILVESSNVKPWRDRVEQACRETGLRFAGPVEVHLTFVCHRPRKVKDAMTGLGRSAGDGDKLTRAVWDALTDSGVIEDDSRVLRWSGRKMLADPGGQPGVWINVRSYR